MLTLREIRPAPNFATFSETLFHCFFCAECDYQLVLARMRPRPAFLEIVPRLMTATTTATPIAAQTQYARASMAASVNLVYAALWGRPFDPCIRFQHQPHSNSSFVFACGPRRDSAMLF